MARTADSSTIDLLLTHSEDSYYIFFNYKSTFDFVCCVILLPS